MTTHNYELKVWIFLPHILYVEVNRSAGILFSKRKWF